MNSSGDNHQSAMYIVSFARSRAMDTAYPQPSTLRRVSNDDFKLTQQ